jgi:diguanylate cyclase (GGDEF)-like protein/PAS domain S-box-containing protein
MEGSRLLGFRNTAFNSQAWSWLHLPLARPVGQFLLTTPLIWLLYGLLGTWGHLPYLWPITVALQVLVALAAIALTVGSVWEGRRQAERQAYESREIYQIVMQHSQDMIIHSRLDGSSRSVSPSVEKLTGWTQGEFLGLLNRESVHPEDRDIVKAAVRASSEGEVDTAVRYRLMHKDGGWGLVEASVRGYSDSDTGPVVGYVVTIHDLAAENEIEDFLSVELAALADKNAELTGLATTDGLTGIANRRTFNQALPVEAQRHAQSGDALSVLMIDVDSFKKFNDRYGHQAGDECLQGLARVFEERIRKESGLAARLGGEEFAVLLPTTDEWGATWLAEDILVAVQQLQMPHADSATGFVSVSIGISSWLPYETTEPELLLQHADEALYESKAAGRNRVTVWNPPAPSLALTQHDDEESADDRAASEYVQRIWDGSGRESAG